jgi:hypothetical protein
MSLLRSLKIALGYMFLIIFHSFGVGNFLFENFIGESVMLIGKRYKQDILMKLI